MVGVDPESIPGILGIRWEYALNGMPVLPPTGIFLGGGMVNLKETHKDKWKTCNTPQRVT